MAEYIEREAVKEALLGWDYDPSDEDVEYTIDHIPAADVEVVKHGRWVAVKDQLPEHCVTVLSYNGCAISTDFYDEAFQCWNSEISYNHIIHVTHWMPLPEKPNCGAKMDLEAQ